MDINVQPKGRSFANSPIYYLVGGETNTNGLYYTADIYLWIGDISTPPVTASNILRITADSNNESLFDVSDFVRSKLALLETQLPADSPTRIQINKDHVINLQITFGFGYDGSYFPDQLTSDITLCTKGWTKYEDGVNFGYDDTQFTVLDQNPFLTSRPNKILMPPDTGFTLAMYWSTDIPVKYIRMWDDNGYEVIYDLNVLHPVPTDSRDMLLYIQCGTDALTYYFEPFDPINEYYIAGLNDAQDEQTETFTFELVDDCPYGSINVAFLNRFGVWDYMTFLGSQKNSLNIKRDRYLFNPLQTNLRLDYEQSFGKYGLTNIFGGEALMLNTGWVDEQYNELISQLLLSAQHIDLGNNDPLNVNTSSFAKKTKLIDRLFNYSIDFKKAYDAINSI